MRKTAILLLALGLGASACGSSDGDPALAGNADDASAVTVAGADSEIVPEGDVRPEDEGDAASVVLVTVDLPEGVPLSGTAIVALEDISVTDTEAVEITRAELPVDQLLSQAMEVELFVPVPLDGSIAVTATVHIDVDENGSFSQGDWISPDVVPVGPASEVLVTVVQI